MNTMNSKPFVEKVAEPVRIVDTTLQHHGSSQHSVRTHDVSTLEDLTSYLQDPNHSSFACRIIFISQRNSWRSLQITEPMFRCIALEHQLSPAFLDLPSCFYDRNMATEEAYSVPYTQMTNRPWSELTYTIRYPEFKQNDGKWAIRQSGICHSLNAETSQSLYVVFSPVPNSALQKRAEQYLASPTGDAELGCFWLHELLFSTYYPAWRRYIASEEQAFLPISGTTFSSYIHEDLRVGYDHLSKLVSLHNHFLQMPAMLAHGAEVLGELKWLINNELQLTKEDTTARLSSVFSNLQRQCLANSRNAVYLQQRIHSTAQLMSDTLALRNQVVAKEQNGAMLQLNKSAVFITMLTLLYLPASFVASFFGMNFFDYDNESGRIVGTSMIWIFLLATFGLTGVTFLSYYWLLKHDGRLFSLAAPTVHLRDWKQLRRRFSIRTAEGEKLPI